MKFPFVVIPELTAHQLDRYRCHIESDASGWHRKWTESIWRRHQDPRNARTSGWKSPADQKRRIIHFHDEYGLDGVSFVLRRAHLWLHVTLPRDDVREYREAIADRLGRGGWRFDGSEPGGRLLHEVWRRGDLVCKVAPSSVHPEDEKRGRAPPPDFASLDLSVTTDGDRPPEGWGQRPWRVFFDVGLRKILPRGEPTRIEPEEIAEYLPAQVELGCGPSIEAGIPHLSTLHRIYGVSHSDYRFVFRAGDDGVLDVLARPEAKYKEMTDIYRACMVAEPTDFYRALRDLHGRGFFVGPIITNNFDCQCADLGLPEISLRRYDWGTYYPTIDYDARARSLLVVGVHADRRLVQMRARERGLKVIFIDPERYVGPDGAEIHYPVEAPQDADLFVRATAREALTRLHTALSHRFAR
jgi:hypothetical protein